MLKYIIIVTCLFSFPNLCVSQETYNIIGLLRNGAASPLIFEKVDSINCEPIYTNASTHNEQNFYIVSKLNCDNRKKAWYLIVTNEGPRWVENFYIKNSKEVDSLLIVEKSNVEYRRDLIQSLYRVKDSLKKITDQQAEIALKRETDSLLREYKKTLLSLRENNIVLRDWSWFYSNDITSFVDVSINIINPFPKKIKYISFTLKAFNPVGDVVLSRGKSSATVQGVGPIDFGEYGTYNFESVFYSKIIENIKIIQIKIRFFDGSEKLINTPKSLN